MHRLVSSEPVARKALGILSGKPPFVLTLYILTISAVLALLWLPFGFSMTALIEEWDLLGLFAIKGTSFAARPDFLAGFIALRPLTPLPFAVAHLLSPDSFIGWHLLMMLGLLVKGTAMAYLVGKATGSSKFGLLAGVLLLLYPADTMQLSFRSIHIVWSGALALLGSAIFLASLNRTNRITANLVALVGAATFFVGSLIYEVALTQWILPLALVLVKHNIKSGLYFLYRNKSQTAVWLLAPLSHASYSLWAASLVTKSYQGSLMSGEKSGISILIDALPKLFSIGATHALFGGWLDAGRILATEYSSYLYLLLIAGAACSCLVWSLVLPSKRPKPSLAALNVFPSNSSSARLIAAGFVLMLIGYAPFLMSAAHLAISQRTFLWAEPGAVMIWLGALALLSNYSLIGAVLVIGALSILGFSAQLFQMHHYVNISNAQRSILKEIVEKFDGNLANKTLVLIDGTNTAGHTWMFLKDGLSYSLSYLYGHRIGPIEICHRASMEWQRADSLARKGTCIEDSTSWTFRSPSQVSAPGYVSPTALPDRKILKSDVIAVTVGSDGNDATFTSHLPTNLENGSDTIARRYRGILKPQNRPTFTLFKDQTIRDHYKWQFGDHWSLEIPIRGSGWREAEWTVRPFAKHAAAWKTRDDAQLFFDFKPEDAVYRLAARFEAYSSPLTKERMRIELNGTDLPLQWHSEQEVVADVPPNFLKAGLNRIDVKSPVDPNYYGLSVRMVSIEISRK